MLLLTVGACFEFCLDNLTVNSDIVRSRVATVTLVQWTHKSSLQGKYSIAMQCIFKLNTIQMVTGGYVCLKLFFFFFLIIY